MPDLNAATTSPSMSRVDRRKSPPPKTPLSIQRLREVAAQIPEHMRWTPEDVASELERAMKVVRAFGRPGLNLFGRTVFKRYLPLVHRALPEHGRRDRFTGSDVKRTREALGWAVRIEGKPPGLLIMLLALATEQPFEKVAALRTGKVEKAIRHRDAALARIAADLMRDGVPPRRPTPATSH